jgi:hypothetical protein
MATRGKYTKQFDITAVIMALAGGGVGNIVSDIAEKNVTMLQNNPALSSAIPGIVGVAGIYFMDDKYKPAFYGMLGSTGANLMDDLNIINGLAGFSRMNNILASNVPPAIPTMAESELAGDMLAELTHEEMSDDEILDEMED